MWAAAALMENRAEAGPLTKDGKAISEWMVNFSDVKEFAREFSV